MSTPKTFTTNLLNTIYKFVWILCQTIRFYAWYVIILSINNSQTLLNLQQIFCGYLLHNLEMLQVEEKLNCETVSLTNDFNYFIWLWCFLPLWYQWVSAIFYIISQVDFMTGFTDCQVIFVICSISKPPG